VGRTEILGKIIKDAETQALFKDIEDKSKPDSEDSFERMSRSMADGDMVPQIPALINIQQKIIKNQVKQNSSLIKVKEPEGPAGHIGGDKSKAVGRVRKVKFNK
jgi:hypothetical protein